MENKLSIVNFGAQKVPDFKEVRGKDWIQFGTEGEWKNRYPEYLLDLYRRSAKHHAIVNSKKDYVVGQGWTVDGEGLNTFQLGKLEQFVRHPNQYEKLDDILEKVALDYELYNGFALEVVYDQLNEKIAAIYHADFARYRSNEDGTCYYYSEDWSKHNPEVEKIEAFNWQNPEGKQLLYVKGYSPDCKYYPLPTYLGSTAYVELDVEIANFHLNSVKNNFVGGTIVSFYNGEPTPEEQEEIERQIKQKFTGTDNANSVILNFADSRDRGVDIQQLNGNDFDKRFEILNKTVQREIYAGHQVTDPALFGIKEDGIFTSRNQLVDSFELFQNTYVNNRQQFIERVFNELAALQGFEGRLVIKDTEPISIQFSESTVVSVMTQNEIREKIGLEPLEEEDEVIAEELRATCCSSQDGEEDYLKYLLASAEAGYNVQGMSKRFDFDADFEKAKFNEDLARKYWFAEIDPIDTAILDILVKAPSTPFIAIADSLKISLERLMLGLQMLNESNAINILIKDVADSSQRVVEVTKKGKDLIKEIPPIKEEFKIRYVYAKRPEAKGPSILPNDRTREFCSTLVNASATEDNVEGGQTWSLREIMAMDLKTGRNVWQRGGGYWGDSYHCRHEWRRVLVTVKR
tara:strand:- start:12322 stop:14217 length:1896 start_codon:yes stop_codon:yes gene_type:complete